MTIEQQTERAVRVFSVAGRVDSITAPELETALDSAIRSGATLVLLDCARLEYLTSAGLRALLVAGKQLESRGGRLAFCAVNPEIATIFNLTNFSLLYAVYPDRAEGLAAMGGNAAAGG